MKIDEWLQDFLMRLRESFPPADWPPVGSEAYDVFYGDFHSAFARNGVSVIEAEDARALLAENPPRFKADYIPKVVGAVKIARELSPATDGLTGAMDDRESAADASKGCKHCHGQGMAIVFASDPEKVRGVTDVSAYCVCALGRWIEGNHREKCPDVHKRTPDLRNVLAGRSFWLAAPPGYDFADNPPVADVPGTLRRWTAAVAAETRASRAPAAGQGERRYPEWMGVREEWAEPEPVPAKQEPRLGDPTTGADRRKV